MNDRILERIARQLSEHFGRKVEIQGFDVLGGGSINRAGKLISSEGSFFIKYLREAHAAPMYACEVRGLELLSRYSPLSVPEPVLNGRVDDLAFLILKHIPQGEKGPGFYEDFAVELAAQHRKVSEKYGLDYNNFIGSLPQSNLRHEDWNSFYIEERIAPMLRLAVDSGLIGRELMRKFDSLFLHVDSIFPKEPPSLLHGDLWGGNHMAGPDGKPWIFDPAVYYGHREMELAFTSVFFAFPSEFYEAYEAAWPLQPGFRKRISYYQLWPLMVHLNLFGNPYLSPVKRILSVF